MHLQRVLRRLYKRRRQGGINDKLIDLYCVRIFQYYKHRVVKQSDNIEVDKDHTAFSLVQSIMLVIAIFSIFLVCGVSSIARVHTDTTIPAPAPGTCPDGWIEAIEGCFLFHHTG